MNEQRRMRAIEELLTDAFEGAIPGFDGAATDVVIEIGKKVRIVFPSQSLEIDSVTRDRRPLLSGLNWASGEERFTLPTREKFDLTLAGVQITIVVTPTSFTASKNCNGIGIVAADVSPIRG